MREPDNAFVADFLGTDRGIKRLSLIPISAVELDPGPVVERTSTVDEARAVMDRYEIDWAAIADDSGLLGWFSAKDLADAGSVATVEVRLFLTKLDIEDSLKEALDAVISSHTSVAAVFDGDRYLGMLTVDTISQEIVQ